MSTPSPIQHDTTPDPRARLTYYDLPTPDTLARIEAQALEAARQEARAGLITLTERAALGAVEAIELAREPLSPERIARAAIHTAATIARAWRGHSSNR